MASASSSWPESTTTGMLGACSRTRRKVSAPRLSGRFRSSSTTEGVSLVSEARPSDSRLTQFTLTGNLLSTSRRRTRSASPRLSSISNTCVVWGSIVLLFSSWRQDRKAEPELFDGLHCRKEIIQISRLSDVAIRAHFVAAHYIFAQLGGAKDHDRNPAQIRACLHCRQDRQPIFLRQIQVEDDQVRADRVRVLFPAV